MSDIPVGRRFPRTGHGLTGAGSLDAGARTGGRNPASTAWLDLPAPQPVSGEGAVKGIALRRALW